MTAYYFSIYGGLNGNTRQDTLDALDYYGSTMDKTYVLGLRSNLRVAKHYLSFGTQYSSDHLDDKTVNIMLLTPNSTKCPTEMVIQRLVNGWGYHDGFRVCNMVIELLEIS